MVTGYDSVHAICSINNQSITEIEQYIEKIKQHYPSCIRPGGQMSIPFEFPPGHQIRIADLKRRSRRRCTSNSLTPTTDASLPMKPPSQKRKLFEDKKYKTGKCTHSDCQS